MPRGLLLLVTALLPAAAVAAEPATPVPFLQGCWIDRNSGGQVAMRLALQPVAGESRLEGTVHEIDERGVQLGPRLSFDAGGATLRVGPNRFGKTETLKRSPPPAKALRAGIDRQRMAAFRAGDAEWVVAQVSDSGLIVYLVESDGRSRETWFMGQRGPCDE